MPATPDPSHYDGADLESLSDLPRYTGWILERFGPLLSGRVLEVGAGLGNVSARYVDRVDEALLIEPARNLHDKLAKRFAGQPHVRTACSLLEDTDPALLARPFDAAVMVNVLEHIPDDVATLERLRELVRPGGAVLVFVPALPWLYGTLDELVHHVRRYTRDGLADTFRQAGLQVGRVEWFDALGIAPWFVVGRLLKARRFDEASARLYDRLGVPLTRLVEDRVPVPIGKSLLAVGFRPNEPEG